MNMLLEGVRNEILKDFAVRTYQLGSPIICEIKGATLIITVNTFVINTGEWIQKEKETR